MTPIVCKKFENSSISEHDVYTNSWQKEKVTGRHNKYIFIYINWVCGRVCLCENGEKKEILWVWETQEEYILIMYKQGLMVRSAINLVYPPGEYPCKAEIISFFSWDLRQVPSVPTLFIFFYFLSLTASAEEERRVMKAVCTRQWQYRLKGSRDLQWRQLPALAAVFALPTSSRHRSLEYKQHPMPHSIPSDYSKTAGCKLSNIYWNPVKFHLSGEMQLLQIVKCLNRLYLVLVRVCIFFVFVCVCEQKKGLI